MENCTKGEWNIGKVGHPRWSPQAHKPVFLLQNSHIQEQSNLITGEETDGGEAVKKHLNLQILASEAVFPRVCH